MSCSVVHRHSLDLVWLWHWLAATALTGPLAWELPYVLGEALKRQKKKKKKKKRKKKKKKEKEKKRKKREEMYLLQVLASFQ